MCGHESEAFSLCSQYARSLINHRCILDRVRDKGGVCSSSYLFVVLSEPPHPQPPCLSVLCEEQFTTWEHFDARSAVEDAVRIFFIIHFIGVIICQW